MTGARAELGADEAAALRRALLGAEAGEPEVCAFALVRSGRALGVVRSDRGPAPDAAAAARLLARGRSGADRVVRLELGPGGVAEVRADPPRFPAAAAARAVARRLRFPLRWLFEDGAYGVLIRPAEGGPARVICARLRAGRLEWLVGGRELGLDAGPFDAVALCLTLRRRVGRPVLVAAAGPEALREIAASARPVSAFERARMRGDLELVALSRRLSLPLVALRLLGL